MTVRGDIMESNEHNNRLRIVLWVGGSLVVLVAGALLLLDLLFTNTMGVHLDGTEASPRMRDAAEQLKAQPGWDLLRDEEVLRGGFCLVLYCPHLEQAWDMGAGATTCQSLRDLLTDSGYAVITHRDTYTPDGNLELENCTRGGYLAAEATAANGSLAIDARIEREHPAAPGSYTFILRITKQP